MNVWLWLVRLSAGVLCGSAIALLVSGGDGTWLIPVGVSTLVLVVGLKAITAK